MRKLKQNTDYIITIKRLYDQEKNRFYDVHIDKGYGYGIGFAIPIRGDLARALKKVFKIIQERIGV